MKKDNNFIQRVDLYIWWLINCSKNILPSQIKTETEQLIQELETVKKVTGINYPSLKFLYKLQFFNFDILKVEEYERNKRNSMAYFFA